MTSPTIGQHGSMGRFFGSLAIYATNSKPRSREHREIEEKNKIFTRLYAIYRTDACGIGKLQIESKCNNAVSISVSKAARSFLPLINL